MSSNDSVENFIEEVALLPGWLTRNLWVMRFLDQQGNEIELKLTEKKNRYLNLLKKYEEKKRMRNVKKKMKKTCLDEIKKENEKKECENIVNHKACDSDDIQESEEDQEIEEDGKTRKILNDELNEILSLQKSVKRLLKEKIQTASQCVHFVRYEFEHLKVEYDKLQKEIEEAGGLDVISGDVSSVSTRRQQSNRHGTGGNGSSVVGSQVGNVNVNNAGGSGSVCGGGAAAGGRLGAEALRALGELGDGNAENKGRSRVNSDIGGGGSTTRRNNNRESSSRVGASGAGGGSDVTIGSAGGLRSGRPTKRTKKSGAGASDVQSNVGGVNVDAVSGRGGIVGASQQQHSTNMGGVTIRMASSRLQQDDKGSIGGGSSSSSSHFTGNYGEGVTMNRPSSNVASNCSGRSSRQQGESADSHYKKSSYVNSVTGLNAKGSLQSQSGIVGRGGGVGSGIGISGGGGATANRRLSINNKGGIKNEEESNMNNNNNNNAEITDFSSMEREEKSISSATHMLGVGIVPQFNNEMISGDMVNNMMESNANLDLESVCPICRDGEGVDVHGNERPMVGCDACDEWFHFDCVNYIPPVDGDEQSNFYCPPCISQGRVPLSEIQKLTQMNQQHHNAAKSRRR